MERTIFQAPSGSQTARKQKATIPRIKLAHRETILNVQRQHWLLPAVKMVLPVVAASFFIIAFIALSSQGIVPSIPRFTTIQIYLSLAAIAIALLIELYIFMDWYYQFYVITTRCLLHMYFFRIGGYYFDEVFLDQIKQQEFSRRASNFVADFLGIYDVSVYFSHIERPEPFVFHAPSNSSIIEDILEDLTVRDIERKERKK